MPVYETSSFPSHRTGNNTSVTVLQGPMYTGEIRHFWQVLIYFQAIKVQFSKNRDLFENARAIMTKIKSLGRGNDWVIVLCYILTFIIFLS